METDKGRGTGCSSVADRLRGARAEKASPAYLASGDLRSRDRTGDPALSPQALSLAG